MSRKCLCVVAVCLLAAIAVPLFAQSTFKLKGAPKIAWVYLNVKKDGGWQEALDEARVQLEKVFGQKIPFTEGVKETPADIRPAVEKFIQRGYNIVNGSAFGYSDTLLELAAKYPDVMFLNPAGTTNARNLLSYYGRTYESQYLCGMAAAAKSKSGKLGFVAAHQIGLVNWTVNGYALGAQKVNPSATVTAIYIGAWYDPVKERAATEALIDQGCDVIGMHVDTPTPAIVAQERGVYNTGHHRDMREFAPKATIASSVWTWERFLTPTYKKVIAGQFVEQPYGAFIGIKDGGVDVTLAEDVLGKDMVNKIMAERKAIINGKHIFAGPLSDRDGKERVKAGQTPSDADLWAMDWFVPGVISQR